MTSCRECHGSGLCRHCAGRGYRGYSPALVEYGSSGRGVTCCYCSPSGSGRCIVCDGRGVAVADSSEKKQAETDLETQRKSSVRHPAEDQQ